MMLQFDTSTIEKTGRVDYWRNSICEHHVNVDVEILDETRFRGMMDISGIGHLQIIDATSRAATYHHLPSHIKEARSDEFLLNYIVEGNATLSQCGRQIEQGQGDLMLYDISRPYALSCPNTMRSYVVQIPRTLLTSRVSRLDAASAHMITGTSPIGRLAGALICESYHYGKNSGAKACPRLSSAILDVVATAIDQSIGDVGPTPAQSNLLDRIKNFILKNLDDPDMSIYSISVAQGISPRTLNRIFAAEGTTLMRWVWKQRLSASYRALAEGTIKQVTTAAFSYGFSDVSHFSRSFKREFGVSPNSFLQ